MKTIKGDLIKLAQEGKFDVIVHGCNCFNTMGAGIAKQIKEAFPQAYAADLRTEKGDSSKLGKYSWTSVVTESLDDLLILNAYTQYRWKTNAVNRTPVNYIAIRQIFKRIKQFHSGKHIAYPAIGAGLAGGNWSIIQSIINEELEGEDHTFVSYSGE